MTNDVRLPPIQRFYDLRRLSQAGYETTIAASPEDRGKIAEWAEVTGVGKFEARVVLRRLAPSRFSYKAHLDAEISQDCTVTLEPVSSRIELDFSRDLHLVPKLARTVDFSSELSPAAGGDEVPEEIDNTNFDLLGPVVEEFLLAIDPYPRSAGAHFDRPAGDENLPESPFAVLKSLKSKE